MYIMQISCLKISSGEESEIEKTRFQAPVSDHDQAMRAKDSMPENTRRRNQWSINTFNSWAISRNNRHVDRDDKLTKIEKSVEHMSSQELSYWLAKFVLEVRKTNGDPYPPKSLLSLVFGIVSHVNFDRNLNIQILSDDDFFEFRKVLDAEMKRLAASGTGAVIRQAQAFTRGQEDLLWRNKILGDYNPRVLVRTILVLNGKHFALRSSAEHRNLRYRNPQITLYEPAGERAYLKYVEDVSKTKQGGLKHIRVRRKEVIHHSNLECPERCHVRLYKKYMKLCPVTKRTAFYLTPLQKPTEQVWYSRQPVGVNQLSKYTMELCKEAGLEGNYTNHSWRATAATHLYQHGVDEQLIMERTGHQSTAGKSH